MNLTQGNRYVHVAGAPRDEIGWLRGYLTFETQVWVRGKPRPKRWTVLEMLGHDDYRFPAGLLPKVAAAAKRAGHATTLTDSRRVPCQPLPHADLAWLREYQQTAVARVLERTTGLLWLPTGSGKTEIAIGLMKLLPCPWLFVVHRATVANQSAQRFEERTGERPGLYTGEERRIARVTFATFQSLYRGLKKGDAQAASLLARGGGLIADESHTVASETFNAVAMRSTAYWRIGLSATPLARGDRRSVSTIAALGPVIFRVSPSYLISIGAISRPTIRMIECSQRPKKRIAKWATAYRKLVVQSPQRNNLVVDMLTAAGKPSMCFVKQLEHARTIAALARARGLNVAVVDGTDNESWRAQRLDDLRNGYLDGVVCTVVFQEGVDVPDLRSVVVAAGGKSAIATLQRIGRGMRATATKRTFEVWDVRDVGQKWLQRHASDRVKAYSREGFTVAEHVTIPRKGNAPPP